MNDIKNYINYLKTEISKKKQLVVENLELAEDYRLRASEVLRDIANGRQSIKDYEKLVKDYEKLAKPKEDAKND